MQLDKDQVITNKLHYDNLLKKAEKLEKEIESKVVKVYISKREKLSGYLSPYDNYIEFTVDTSIGEKVPEKAINILIEVIKELKETHDLTIAKKEENFKILREVSINLSELNKKLKAIPKWKKWILNIKTDDNRTS